MQGLVLVLETMDSLFSVMLLTLSALLLTKGIHPLSAT